MKDWILQTKVQPLADDRSVVFFGCYRPRLVILIVLNTINSIISYEPSYSSWLPIILKAAMDAVIRVRQKTLAVDANHLLCDHLFFFPI